MLYDVLRYMTLDDLVGVESNAARPARDRLAAREMAMARLGEIDGACWSGLSLTTRRRLVQLTVELQYDGCDEGLVLAA